MGWGKETFSLFVTLELGAEENPTEESYKKLRGRGRAAREHWPSTQRITASLAGLGGPV